MPLTGEAKRLYQRRYMRTYMQKRRVKTPEMPVKTLLRPSVKTLPIGAAAPLETKQETLTQLRQTIDALQSTRSPLKGQSSSRIPLYNWQVHGPGDKVRMPDGQVVIIPELDEDGNTIQSGSTGHLVSDNLLS